MANKWSPERRAKYKRTMAVKHANKKIGTVIPLDAIPARPARATAKRPERTTSKLELAMAIVQLLREVLR